LGTLGRISVAADAESRVHDDHHETLRLWLRLLTCTLTIEGKVRARLRERFATTLPRFDLMAQLERNPKGLKMGELSRRLMVTGGNVRGSRPARRRGSSGASRFPATGAPTPCSSRPKASGRSIPWRRSTNAGSRTSVGLTRAERDRLYHCWAGSRPRSERATRRLEP
jgi:hypothetical protein